MSTEYDKLTIGDKIVINIYELSKNTRYTEKKETVTYLEKLRLKDLVFEYVIEERPEEEASSPEDPISEIQPFIAVYLFGLIDGYKKLELFEEYGELTKLHKVRYYHHNTVSKYVEEGKEEFLEIIREIEEQFRFARGFIL